MTTPTPAVVQAAIDHGTYAGYQAHKRADETPCDPCRTAMRDYARKRRSKPEVRAREMRQQLARERALSRLAKKHRREYARLYAEEMSR